MLVKGLFFNFLKILKKIVVSHKVINAQKNSRSYVAKKFCPFYLEHLKFLIVRAGCIDTKIYSHFTFEQERFKINFILVSHRSRQNAKAEKEFLNYSIILISVMIVVIILITVHLNLFPMKLLKFLILKGIIIYFTDLFLIL